MTDELSNIIDFYPKDFEIDTDGILINKWQKVVCKLPFIDESRLLAETRKLEKELGEEEDVRHANNDDLLIVRSSNKLGSQILELNQNQPPATIDIRLSGGFSGRMRPFYEDSDIVKSNSPAYDIQKDTVLCVFYDHPSCSPYLPRLLAGVECPHKTIFDGDIKDTSHWRHFHGSGLPFSRNSGWLGKEKAVASTSKSGWNFQHDTRTPIGSSSSSSSSLYSRRNDYRGQDYNASRGSSDGSHWRSQNFPRDADDDTTMWRSRGSSSDGSGTLQNDLHLTADSSTQSLWRSQNMPSDIGTMRRARGSSDSSGTETNSRW